jgi:beta-galactosidase
VGTLPDPALARSLVRSVAPVSRQTDAWRRDLPPSVTVHGATARAGRLRFVHNWSWHPAELPLPVACTDLLSGSALGAGEPLTLTAWDVRVLVERDGPVRDHAAAEQEATP